MTTFPVWVGFKVLIVGLLVFACGGREIYFRPATIVSLFRIVLAALFGAVVFALAGRRGVLPGSGVE